MDEDRTFDEFLNEHLNSESKQYREEFKKELLKLDIKDKEAANGQNKESETTLWYRLNNGHRLMDCFHIQFTNRIYKGCVQYGKSIWVRI